MKPLLVYLKPKDNIPQVEEAVKDITCDKLILKYFPYPEVYRTAHRMISQLKEYTHIIWLQNDIVLNYLDYARLCHRIQQYNFDILGCAMNVDLSPEGMNLLAYTKEPFLFDEKRGFIDKDPPYVKRGTDKGTIPIFHNGGVFICKRDFYLKYPLKGFPNTGYNADLCHGIELNANNELYLLDSDITLLHLRYKGDMMVGRKPRELLLEK